VVNCELWQDLTIFIPHFIETLTTERIQSSKNPQIICCPNTEPKADMDMFTTAVMIDLMELINNALIIGI
jgi:hypothetical protein